MITESDYKLMKELVDKYESGELTNSNNDAYIIEYKLETVVKYNPNFGNDKKCLCGHPYYRHFDTYEDMEACGCKYCGCYEFKLHQSENRENKLNELGI